MRENLVNRLGKLLPSQPLKPFIRRVTQLDSHPLVVAEQDRRFRPLVYQLLALAYLSH
jgi:hypothetical protein